MEQNQNPGGSQQLPTINSQPTTSSKHFKAFWPIVLIATLSALIGGLVVWAAFNAGLDEELNSLLPGADTRIAEKHKNFELQPMTSQANESTADWQTYRNEEYGFEFKYPANLKLTVSGSKTGTYRLLLAEEDNNLFMFVIRINRVPDIEINNSSVGRFYNLAFENKVIKIISIDDTDKTYSNPNGVVFKSSISNDVISSYGDIYYFTSSQIYNPNSNVDLYADILSTFKFIK